MSEGQGMASWAHTAQLLCMMANVNRDPKRKPFGVEEFYPYREKKRVTLSELKEIVNGGRPGNPSR